MTVDSLPLFAWRPPNGEVITFPLSRQGWKVRETARKLFAKSTARHADYYREQVTDALVKRLRRIGIADHLIDEQVFTFWIAVDQEMIRLSYLNNTSKLGG